MRGQYGTIDEYIKTFPENVQVILEKMRQTIRDAAPGAVEAISYQMPTFKLNGRNLVHFAAFKGHIGFYPIPSGMGGVQGGAVAVQAGQGLGAVPPGQAYPV
jgi:uncharacterized protein YdhG (YjbR/CyaY superfamily)